MDLIPQIVLQNPYRILGVYANSAKRDIVANKGKATAFLKVNRPVEYLLDLKGIMPSPTRTLDSMNNAEAHLAIAKEQIKYAQFWFIKITPIDDIAFNHLLAGNMDGAKEIWSKQESLSSLQNTAVCYLIESKPWLAIKAAEKLYEKFGDKYISKIDANCTLQMTPTDLLHQFIDSLGEEIGMLKLLEFELDEDTKTYIRSQTIGPLINKISAEVDKAKKVNHKDSKARIEAASKLCTNTKNALQQLRNILPDTDSQYQMIADKLGLEILQCSIDYYNNAKDDADAPQRAMWLLKHAQSIVAGNLAKQRCEENAKVLQKNIDQLPPKEIIPEAKCIKAELSNFIRMPEKISYAITLLNNTKPHLQSIKNKLGSTNNYYLKLSTQVVSNALQNIVKEVNDIQNDSQIAFRMQMGIELDSSSLYKIKSTLRETWKATTIMDDFDVEPQFKSFYTQNRSTLKSMCDDMGVSTSTGRILSTSILTSRSTNSTSSKKSSTQSRSSKNNNRYRSSSSSEGNGGCAIFVFLLFFVILLALADYNNSTRPSSIPIKDSYYNETQYSTGDCPYESFYGDGEYDMRTSNSLTIKNENDRDAVVFLETTYGEKIRHVYIKASNDYTMSNIPAGDYIVKIIQGVSWNPNKDNGQNAPKGGFMKKMSMSESGSTNIMEFPTVESGQYGTYEMTLYKVQNGNMYTREIGNAEMFN